MQGFEPYVLVSKTKVPWYDERFTGYLENKILHTQTMVYWGFEFAVHPNVFRFITHIQTPITRLWSNLPGSSRR